MPHWDVASTEVFRFITENYNTIMPIMVVLTAIIMGMRLLENVKQTISGALNDSNDRTIEVQAKRKNDEMFIPAEVGDKPKHQIMRVGDNGELVYEAEIHDE
jgi:uncharacterized membrane protein